MLVYHYVRWHYTTALVEQVRIAGNLVWMCTNVFSLRLLAQTLFAPFHRLNEPYTKGFLPAAWAETVVVNTLMRIVGFLLRILVLGIGSVAVVCVVLGAAAVFIVWLAAPVLVFVLLTASVTFLRY